jgi:acyl-CoA thioesterase I
MRKQCSFFLTLCLFMVALISQIGFGQAPLKLLSPVKYEVVQREYWVPQLDYVNRAAGAVRGFGLTELKLEAVSMEYDRAEVQIIKQSGELIRNWQMIELMPKENCLVGTLQVPAGGWYSAKVRLLKGETVIAEGLTEAFGVGEVFIVAGQSYATNCNDTLFSVKDPEERVVCWDRGTASWRVAHDPQPVVDGTKDGSIWPLVGDELVDLFDVPIAFVNVAYGGTSSEQWLPQGDLHKNLVEACSRLQKFRGVLWQQGESDVIDKRSTDKYVQNLVNIRDTAFASLKYKPYWWLAKSTLHPTVYVDPQHEHAIRRGYEILVDEHGFDAGPDTDRLGGENRGGPNSRRHFSEMGQLNAAKLWVATLYHDLTKNAPEHWAVHAELNELKLRDYGWSESTIWNESSVALSTAGNQEATARLAFPAEKVLSVRSANRNVTFEKDKDYFVSEDGLTVTFKNLKGLPAIAETDLYKPAGAPQSYRHRAGNPEENLLYAPGRWFHDRNVEITYKRPDEAAKLAPNAFAFGQLPKTLKRLVNGDKIRLAISGDSISTGLDASGTTQAIPNQFGYAELIAAQLEKDFGSSVTLTNRSVPGWSVANGVSDLGNLLKAQPNLIVVAYGMNDVGRRDPKWFAGQLSELLKRIKEYDADCEVIIVSPMLGNPEWVHTPREMFDLYRDEMKNFAGEGVALADVTAVWSLYNENKHFLDMTGNGLNHPNDYGHRVYAQGVLSCLPTRQQ